MISSRKLEDLYPRVKERAEQFIYTCAEQGIDVIIVSTYRDEEAQAALYAQGRTSDGKRCTNAKPGWSWHNWRCAFDFVPIVNGKARWDDIHTFKRCGLIAESLGLEWAGRWETFKEMGHCQYTGGLTLADFQSGKRFDPF